LKGPSTVADKRIARPPIPGRGAVSRTHLPWFLALQLQYMYPAKQWAGATVHDTSGWNHCILVAIRGAV